jgi:hypothetical protein
MSHICLVILTLRQAQDELACGEVRIHFAAAARFMGEAAANGSWVKPRMTKKKPGKRPHMAMCASPSVT